MPSTLVDLARGWSVTSQQLAEKPRVLIVDDESGVRDLFAAILSRARFDCTVCDSAEAALERFGEGHFDILVTDKNLPGESGLELIAKVRQLDPACEAVLVTAYPNLDSVVRAIDLSHVEFLTKPLDSIELLTAVVGRATLRRRRRLLARRMLDDLREALSEHADGTAVGELHASRDRLDAYRAGLERKRRIVCWDGEAPEVHGALSHLKDVGFEVWRAKDGGDVREMCDRHQVGVLLVSDHYGDIDSSVLLEALSEADGHPELVYVTGQASFERAMDATHRGAAGYIVKPVSDPRPLLHAVRRAAELHQERMVHFKMVSELSRILMGLDERRDHEETKSALEAALADFDVTSAEHAIGRWAADETD